MLEAYGCASGVSSSSWRIEDTLRCQRRLVQGFTLGRLPRVDFGSGRLKTLPALLRACGEHALVVTGAGSFTRSRHWPPLEAGLRAQGLAWTLVRVHGEPTAPLVDETVAALRDARVDVVVGIGGGSALDVAKAIAGLLRPGNSVMDHLEGVGPERPYRGPAVPFVAVPTTAGTGSEATRNAVLGVPAAGGVKKSFRDERLVADLALVDPDLLDGCPREVAASCGMDALTQLIESYVSTKATPFTDALVWSGLEALELSFLRFVEQQSEAGVRPGMAYAALVSGMTLSQAGLGIAHGLASPLGGLFPIPHGTACGAVVAAATRVNVAALREREPASTALVKYERVGRLLARDPSLGDGEAATALVETLTAWTRRVRLPGLWRFGVTHGAYPALVAGARAASSTRTNPIVLTDGEIEAVLAASQ
jgi:alcohol dehydrogenase class IV